MTALSYCTLNHSLLPSLSLSSLPSPPPLHSIYYRSGTSILHNLIVATQRPNAGYTLNGLTLPVLYKLIHYYMENPIQGTTVLKYPIEDKDVSL